MTFFKRERRLSDLIRAADPLGVDFVSTPGAMRPGQLVWLLPVFALTFFFVFLAPHKKKPRPHEVMVSPQQIALSPHAKVMRPQRVTMLPHKVVIAPRHKRELLIKKTLRPRHKTILIRRKITLPRRKSRLPKEKNDLATPASPAPGEMIIVAVRPITSDELRQELQTP